jgi:hypothetical protein
VYLFLNHRRWNRGCREEHIISVGRTSRCTNSRLRLSVSGQRSQRRTMTRCWRAWQELGHGGMPPVKVSDALQPRTPYERPSINGSMHG